MENTHQDQVRSLLESVERTVTPTQQTSSLLVVLRRIATDVAAVRDLLETEKPAGKPYKSLRRYVLDTIEKEKIGWLAAGSSAGSELYMKGVVDALDDLTSAFGTEEGDPLDV